MSNNMMLTVMGLYHYNDRLFENMKFPTGFTAEDKSTTINNILLECSELELLYPSWDTMHEVIPMWSGIEMPVWQRIYNASKLEYNPIENYNRLEESTVTHSKTEEHSGNDVTSSSGTDSQTGNESSNKTVNGSDNESNSGTDVNVLNTMERHSGTDSTSYSDRKTDSDSGHNITENSMTSYDSNSLYVHDVSDLSLGKTTTGTDTGTSALAHGETISNTGTESMQHGHNITKTSNGTETNNINKRDTITHNKTDTLAHGETIDDSGEMVTESHITGNIGVTTSQQMLEQELQIAPKLNIMKLIAESFKQRFCLLVY